MDRAVLVAVVLACLLPSCKSAPAESTAEQQLIQLSTILPKLEAIHEDSQALLKKNAELRTIIVGGLPAKSESKLKSGSQDSPNPQPPNLKQPPKMRQPSQSGSGDDKSSNQIDYVELEEFNRWVGVNLDYAVKNTLATIDTLKEEAQQNNGKIDYSDQAINDGIEGVKYWQSAVIFQDKTLKHEKFDEKIVQ